MSALKGHPKGLYLIFATSTAERFSYYGMRAIFILFLTQALLFDKEAAASIYGSYTGLVYLTPLIGGYIADKYWGIRRSVFWGAVMMAVGQFLMFMSASTLDNTNLAHWMMYGGLGFLILGNGCFKPTVSSLVGQLYEPGDRRLDAAYTIFYMGVNVGSFAAPLICGYLGDTGDPHDFKWGFLAAGIMTLFTVVLFETQKNKYLFSPSGEPIGIIPDAKREKKEDKAEHPLEQCPGKGDLFDQAGHHLPHRQGRDQKVEQNDAQGAEERHQHQSDRRRKAQEAVVYITDQGGQAE